jgi:NADH dehydrogenase [ubiquinone] 1 alpha subcomplex assembly factor 7
VIDYGHIASAVGDTLQAVHAHEFADPLTALGEADLTAHLDFQALAQAADSMGARVFGPLEQAEFLRRLGIDSRSEALKVAAPHKAEEIEAARERLTNEEPAGMGRLFKAIAFANPKLGALPCF